MKRLIVNALAVIAVVGFVAGGWIAWYVFSGRYDIAASRPHYDLVGWSLDRVFNASVTTQARGLIPPEMGEADLAHGASLYAANCARCHASPGGEHADWVKGLRPVPPHLPEEGSPFMLTEIFWLVRNGARMTAMPAWQDVLIDDEIWAVALFAEALPQISADRYQGLIERHQQQQQQQPQETDDTSRLEPPGETAGTQAETGAPDAGEEDAAQEGADAAPATETLSPPSPPDDGADEQQPDEPAEEQAARPADAQPPENGDEQQDTGSAAVVEMTDSLTFSPETVTIKAGETVLWRNTSDIQHTVTADQDEVSDPQNMHLPEGAEPFDSGTLGPGAEWSHTFDVPGRYKYFCIPHEAAAMIGEVIVEE